MKTPSRVMLFAAGALLTAWLGGPLPAAAAGLLVASVGLRVGVMLSAARGEYPEDVRAAERPSRPAALHAAHV